MPENYTENETFRGVSYHDIPPEKGEYVNCSFINCDFSAADLAGIRFMECVFENCNFSTAKANKTAWQDVKFRDCKLLGLNFGNSNPFLLSLGFERCILDLASFYKLKIKNTTFKDCSLEEADFTEADLTGSVFDNCNLNHAAFERTVLEKVDFRTAYNYAFDPEINRIRKAKFSILGLAGLLIKYDIEIE